MSMQTENGGTVSKPRVIFENSDVLVIDKPAGLIVHSDGRTHEPSVCDWVIARHPEMKGVGEPWISPQGNTIDRPGIVHRLDRTTSGVMIIARTQTAHAFLKAQFQARTVAKKYLALVYGHPKENGGVIEAEIGRSATQPRRWSAQFGAKGNKRAAITHWRVIKRFEDPETATPLALIEAQPKTGRTHQIRVHLKAIGYPIICDPLYAEKKPCLFGFTRPALHAWSLALELPDGTRAEFEASPPEGFAKVLT